MHSQEPHQLEVMFAAFCWIHASNISSYCCVKRGSDLRKCVIKGAVHGSRKHKHLIIIALIYKRILIYFFIKNMLTLKCKINYF